jgi:GTP-binding protein EngB required for normal cell division
VITTVAYGSKEQVLLRYEGRILAQDAPIAELPLYITQQGNPGNVRRLKMAEVQLPAEFLRRGFYFVDTPGLGSAIEENTRTTERFLPEADALVLVTSFESPLTEEEMHIVKAGCASGRRVFVVVNKKDCVSSEERASALGYIAQQLELRLSNSSPLIFAVSAHEGLAAKLAKDESGLAASGMRALEDELVHFLLREKRTQFLLRMCNRVEDLARQLPSSVEIEPVLQRVEAVRGSLTSSDPGSAPETARSTEFVALHERQPCEICARTARALWDFLCKYQYDLAVRPQEQRRLAEHGGLCSFHTWYYASNAAPRDICKGYPELLETLAKRLREAATTDGTAEMLAASLRALVAAPNKCVLCAARSTAEREAVTAIAGRLAKDQSAALEDLSTICMPHFAMLAASVHDRQRLCRLVDFEATMCERIAEDMRRCALKHDGVRRGLISDEEDASAKRALMLVAGHGKVNATAKVG